MKNELGLPAWLVEVVEQTRNQYDPGEKTDYSATSLLVPPMIYALQKEHQPEEDVRDALPAFLGSGLHNEIENCLKQNPRYLVEERLYAEIDVPDSPTKKTFIVSAQLDLYDKELCEVSDHKLSKIFSFRGNKPEYEFQLNFQAWLLRKHGYETKALKINGFAKDWSFVQTEINKDYPKALYVPVEFPLWDDVDVEEFTRRAIVEKENAKIGQIRVCSPEERWAKPTQYKVRREGRKTALRVLNSRQDAEQYIANLSKPTGKEYIEEIEGDDTRCKFYCNVREHCSFYKEKYGK